jgi:glycosyltransferase 2 family protein
VNVPTFQRSTIKSLLRIGLWLIMPVLIWWAVRDIPLDDVKTTLQNLNWGPILIILGVNLGLMLIFSARWCLILRGYGYQVPYLALSGYRLAAFGISYFTPGPQFGGEPFQVAVTRNRYGVPGTTALAAVSLDKLIELLANFTFLVVSVLVLFAGKGLSNPAILAAVGGLLALPLGYLLAVGLNWRPLTWVFSKTPGVFSNFRMKAILNKSQGFQKFGRLIMDSEAQIAEFCQTQPKTLILATFISGLVWVGLIFEYWLAIHFLGQTLTLTQIIAIMAAARLALLFPLPGGLGAFEAGQIIMMETLGLNPALGVGVAVIIRARDVVFGGLGLLWGGVLGSRMER